MAVSEQNEPYRGQHSLWMAHSGTALCHFTSRGSHFTGGLQNSIQTATVLKVIKMWTVLIKWQLFNGLKGLMSCSSNRHTDSLSCRDGVMWLQKQKTFIHSPPPWKKEAVKKFAQVPLSDDGKHLIETYLPVIWGMKRKRLQASFCRVSSI